MSGYKDYLKRKNFKFCTPFITPEVSLREFRFNRKKNLKLRINGASNLNLFFN